MAAGYHLKRITRKHKTAGLGIMSLTGCFWLCQAAMNDEYDSLIESRFVFASIFFAR